MSTNQIGYYKPISYVQGVAGNANQGSTAGLRVTASYYNVYQIDIGDTLVVIAKIAGIVPGTTASDSAGNTFNLAVRNVSSSPTVEIWYSTVTNAIAGSQSGTITFTLNLFGSTAYKSCQIIHLKNVNTDSPVGQTAIGGSSGISTTNYDSAGFGPGKSSSVVVFGGGMAGTNSSASYSGLTSGWTNASVVSPAFSFLAIYEQPQSGAGNGGLSGAFGAVHISSSLSNSNNWAQAEFLVQNPTNIIGSTLSETVTSPIYIIGSGGTSNNNIKTSINNINYSLSTNSQDTGATIQTVQDENLSNVGVGVSDNNYSINFNTLHSSSGHSSSGAVVGSPLIETETDADTDEVTASIISAAENINSSLSNTSTTTTDAVTGATIIETASDVNNATSGVQALVGQPIQMLTRLFGSRNSSSLTAGNVTFTESTKGISTGGSSINGSRLSAAADVKNNNRSLITTMFGNISSFFNINGQQIATQKISGKIIASVDIKQTAQPASNSFVSGIIKSVENVSNNITNKTLVSNINILALSITTFAKHRAKFILINVAANFTNVRSRFKKILIVVNSNVAIIKSIRKKILIFVSGVISHAQTLITNDWSLTNQLSPNDFSEADESEELVLPTDTDFDYSKDNNGDPLDFGVSDEN